MPIEQQILVAQNADLQESAIDSGLTMLMPGAERDLSDANPVIEIDEGAMAQLRCGSCRSGNSGNSGSGSRSGNSSCRSSGNTGSEFNLAEKAA